MVGAEVALGKLMPCPIPIYLRGQQLMVISRTMSTENEDTIATPACGTVSLTATGRETVLVMPVEEVHSQAIPGLIRGLYWPVLYHCQNLEHEDLGMTRNFHVS